MHNIQCQNNHSKNVNHSSKYLIIYVYKCTSKYMLFVSVALVLVCSSTTIQHSKHKN